VLTLDGNVRLGPFTIFRDVAFDAGVRTLTSTFYALPDAPRLSADADGGPAFRFWWYRRSLDAASGGDAVRAGGLLVVTVDLGPTVEERAQLKHDLAAQFHIDDEQAIALLPMPFVSGTVALEFAGDTGGASTLVNQVGGNGPARLMGNEQAAFAIDLTADGAALLASAIDRQLAVLHVSYDLVFEYHLDGVRLRVWCDARRAQIAASAQASAGALDPATLRSGLVVSQAAGIDISADTPVPRDQQAALQKLGEQLLDAALAATVVAPDGRTARPYDASMSGTLNHTFTSSFAARQQTAVETSLLLAVDDAMRATRITTIDLANQPQPIDVTVLCPVDFVGGPIAAVHVFIAYDGSGPDGRPLDRQADVVFKAGTGSFSFHSLASADDRRYRWHADVQYRDGSKATLPEVLTDDPLLILAIDGLGVLDVDVSLGDVPLDLVGSVVVDLEYPPKGLTHQVILDGAHAAAAWQPVVGQVSPDALRWRATFVTTDGRRIVGDWQAAVSTRVIVDAPRDLGITTDVQLVSAGDFSGLAQIVVDVAWADGRNPAQFAFTKPGQTARWSPRGLPAGGAVNYRARRTVIGADGISRAFDWTDENSPLLVVSDESRFTVQIVSRLLDLGGAWSSAAVALEHVDGGSNLDERDTVVFRDRAADGAWSFRLGASNDHAYRYQLTLVPHGGGERRVFPWQDARDEVLVLRGPAA